MKIEVIKVEILEGGLIQLPQEILDYLSLKCGKKICIACPHIKDARNESVTFLVTPEDMPDAAAIDFEIPVDILEAAGINSEADVLIDIRDGFISIFENKNTEERDVYFTIGK